MKLKTQLSEKIQRLIDENRSDWPATVLAVQAEFSGLVRDSATVKALLLERLTEVKEYKDDKSELVGNDIILVRGEGFAISLRYAESTVNSNLATNSDVFFIAALDRPLKYRCFTPVQRFDLNVFDPEVQLIEQLPDEAPAMSVVKFDDAQTLFEILVDQPSKIMRLVLSKPPTLQTTQLWSFSRQTLRPLGMSASHYRDTAAVHVCEALAEISSDTSVAPLTQLAAAAPSHFVRWAAIKALANIDADLALPVIVSAQADIHPHVRSAALAAEQQLI
ncbi:MAG: HEAT repeat domain-containing protein [Duganella sp.]